MLIRRMRVCEYDPFTDEVKSQGRPDYLGVPERVIPAPPKWSSDFTDVVCITYKSGRLHFLADVVGSPNGDQYISTGEAARLLGVEDRTVRRWAKAGRMESVRTLGGEKRRGSWRVSVASVRALMPDGSDLDAGLDARRYVAPIEKPVDRTPKRDRPTPGQIDMEGRTVE